MCGRFTRYYSWAQVHDYLSLLGTPLNLEPKYNVAPTTEIEVAVADDGARHMQTMRWGLLPPWAKDLAFGSKTFNARGETVAEKPSFRSAFKSRRCLVPVSGFYEWKRSGDSKTPFHITLPDSEIMVFAGLWEENTRLADEAIQSFTIVTCEPNPFMADIHSRMPVILEPEQFELWLDPESEPEQVQELIGPYEGAMQADEVDRKVGNVRNKGPELIEPVSGSK